MWVYLYLTYIYLTLQIQDNINLDLAMHVNSSATNVMTHTSKCLTGVLPHRKEATCFGPYTTYASPTVIRQDALLRNNRLVSTPYSGYLIGKARIPNPKWTYIDGGGLKLRLMAAFARFGS